MQLDITPPCVIVGSLTQHIRHAAHTTPPIRPASPPLAAAALAAAQLVEHEPVVAGDHEQRQEGLAQHIAQPLLRSWAGSFRSCSLWFPIHT